VSHQPTEERRYNNRKAAHGRGALFGHVVFWPHVFLAKDWLSLTTGLEEYDQVARTEK
jgi:hypothetical protein